MKKAAFSLLFCCLIGLAQGAPPSDESILKLMSALQLQATLDQMVAQLDTGMKTALKQSMEGKTVNPVLTAELDQLQKKMSATIKDELSFARMKDIYVGVYRETFTQEEVNGITAFCATPAGKAMLQKIPEATLKANKLLQARMGPIAQKVKAMQQDFIRSHTETR